MGRERELRQRYGDIIANRNRSEQLSFGSNRFPMVGEEWQRTQAFYVGKRC
jgi:hypothetical protein